MSYEPFFERFGELARKETRSVSLRAGNQFGLPADDYGLLELYFFYACCVLDPDSHSIVKLCVPLDYFHIPSGC